MRSFIKTRLTGQERKRILKKDPNKHLSAYYQIGAKVLILGAGYTIGEVKGIRYEHKHSRMVFKVELQDTKNVVELDQSQIYEYKPYWLWWIISKLGVIS